MITSTPIELKLDAGKSIFFASDFHLGVPSKEKSLERELKLVQWLNEIAPTAQHIFLVGDLFDFWFEYKHVVPKGFVRFLGKLAELADKGIELHIFIGNHDMWMFDYLKQEFGAKMYREPQRFIANNQEFYIGHGDGLGPGDNGYKVIKQIFRNPVCIFLFKWIHPDVGVALANFWSKKSRNSNKEPNYFLGPTKEWLYQYCEELDVKSSGKSIIYIFGHRHLPINEKIGESNSRYINLGEWISYFSYAQFTNNEIELKYFIA